MRILIFQVCFCVSCLYLFLTCQKKIDLVPIAISCQVFEICSCTATDMESCMLTGRKEEMHSAVVLEIRLIMIKIMHYYD